MAERNRKRKGPRRVTAERLERQALHYLERYASSAENLRAVLRRKVWRAARVHETDEAEAEAWIDDIVVRFVRAGLVDDAVYARGRAAALRRAGHSGRAIRLRLAAKGVDSETVDTALAGAEEEAGGDVKAAIAHVRRRRLGPLRPSGSRSECRQRDMAALARRGFAPDLVRRVIDAEDDEALDAMIEEARELSA